ncbi:MULTISPECIES: PucR family transcriptional regulator [unclassified Streptomyces]|uniref:PucR family transcriptional regulator n=1 Tax=unclassified Streptomyces TaxID=2593676 RepID=UPI00382B9FF6
MSLTVEGALSLEVFSRVPVTVYAGEAQLHRGVRWVHPVEIPDIARFLTGGELLLTAGLGIAHTADAQRAYVRDIAAAGAAVLILELSGRAYTTMPRPLVEEAARLGFPLVGLDGELPFVEVSAQVHERLVDQRIVELTAYERLNETVMRLLLAGRDNVAFAQALAEEIAWPVILEDSSRRVVAYAAGTDVSDTAVSAWDTHSRVLHSGDAAAVTLTSAALVTPDGRAVGHTAQCTRRAVVIRGEPWGWLHVVHDTDVLHNVDRHAIDRTAEAIAVSVLSAREVKAQAAHRENALVNRLLLGDLSGDSFITRALRLGKDLRGRSLVVAYGAKSAPAGEQRERIAAACDALTVPAVIAEVGEDVVAVAGLARPQDEPAVHGRLTREAVCAGLSRPCPPRDLPTALRQARSAASVAASRTGRQVVRFDDLGVLRLLVSLAQGPELANYVEDELGPVLRHDAGSAHPLLPTLRAFLENDGNKSQTAEQLFIQRRTLYYRLDRIDTLLGRTVEDNSVRQDLLFALRGKDLLDQTDGRDPARGAARAAQNGK